MIRAWETLSKRSVHRAPIFDLQRVRRRHPEDGREADFYALELPDWVNVLALTPAGELVFVRQYRHGTDTVTLEIPGGMIDAGESPIEAAQRELAEETGYVAEGWIEIGSVEPNPAFMDNRCATLLGFEARAEREQNPDELEELEVELHPREAFDELIVEGAITHALVVAAALHLRCWEERRGADQG